MLVVLKDCAQYDLSACNTVSFCSLGTTGYCMQQWDFAESLTNLSHVELGTRGFYLSESYQVIRGVWVVSKLACWVALVSKRDFFHLQLAEKHCPFFYLMLLEAGASNTSNVVYSNWSEMWRQLMQKKIFTSPYICVSAEVLLLAATYSLVITSKQLMNQATQHQVSMIPFWSTDHWLFGKS